MFARQEIVARLWRSNLFIETEANVNNIVRKLRAEAGLTTRSKPRARAAERGPARRPERERRLLVDLLEQQLDVVLTLERVRARPHLPQGCAGERCRFTL